jgi:hypothetical protein
MLDFNHIKPFLEKFADDLEDDCYSQVLKSAEIMASSFSDLF